VVLALALLFQGDPVAAQSVESAVFGAMLASLLSHSVPEIGVQEARERTACEWLDAREPAEFAVSRIARAHHVGFEKFDLAAVAGVDRAACVIVYCAVGYRSEKIAEKLRAAGFSDVHNVYGGIFEWVNRGYPVVDADGAPTTAVHAYSRLWGIWLRRGEKVY